MPTEPGAFKAHNTAVGCPSVEKSVSSPVIHDVRLEKKHGAPLVWSLTTLQRPLFGVSVMLRCEQRGRKPNATLRQRTTKHTQADHGLSFTYLDTQRLHCRGGRGGGKQML